MKFANNFMLILLGLLWVLLIPDFGAGQDRIDENDIKDMVQRNIVPTVKKTEVKGSPYFSEDFTKGSFELYSGRFASDLNMNYNIYEKRIEYKTNNNTYAIDPAGIRQFTLTWNDHVYTFKRGFESRRLSGDEFVEVVEEGVITFLIKHEVSFNENSSSSYGSATKNASYTRNERYYFLNEDEISYQRKINHRRVMRNFNGDKSTERFIQKNNLDMSNPEDVAKAVRRFNELDS